MPYTFIDVGLWMQLYLPLPLRSKAPQPVKDMTWSVYAEGAVRNLVTNREHIGTYVARILADPCMLNQAVIVWEDEVTANVAQDIGVRASGDGDALKAKRIHVSALLSLLHFLTTMRLTDVRDVGVCRRG